MKTKKPNHNAIVAKDNSLVGELAKFELSELRMVAFCLAHFDSRNSENSAITARVSDLTAIFPSMDEGCAYAVVRRAMLGINKKPFEFVATDGTHYFFNWFEGFAYKPTTGEFSFFIAEKMRPYLLGLKETFTQYRLKDVYQFKAASTWKLYENLAQWRANSRWVVDLDEFRFRLGVAGQYPRWNNLKQWLIEPAIEEINTLSDIRVEYHQDKRGRRVVGLVFLIDKKEDDDKTIVLESPEDTIYKALLSYGIHEKTAAEYAKNINRQDKVNQIVAKLPSIAERARKNGQTMSKYILGAIKRELDQENSLDESEPPQPKAIQKITPGMKLRHRQTGQVMTVEEGNVVRLDNGTVPEGFIRQHIQNGTFVLISD